MKVLVVNWRDIKNPEAGGAEVYIDEILKRKPAGWQVDFVAASFKGCEPTEDINGYHIIRIPNNFLFNFTFRRYWKKVLSRKGYDLVVDVVSKIPLATPLYIKNTPLAAIHYHIHGLSLFKELAFPMAFYVYWMERLLLRSYRKIPTLLIAESDQKELFEKYRFTDTRIAYCGIDTAFMAGRDPRAKSLIPTVMTFGRLKKYKRVDHAIKAFALVLKDIPDAVFNIAGKGDYEDRLKELARELGIEKNVRFLGFISEEDKGKYVSESWLFTITSEKEGWGIVVIEAAAGALPALGYNVEGVRDSLRDGETGFLVPNGDIEALALRMKQLLTDEELRRTLSEAALAHSDKFRWENTAAGFYKMTDEMLGKK